MLLLFPSAVMTMCSVLMQCMTWHILEEIVTLQMCTHQRADTFAKALPRDTFRYLRSKISGRVGFMARGMR